MPTRRALFAALPALLAGCGFHPLYAPRPGGSMGAAQAGLAAIAVGPIPERAGQLLRQALQDHFERAGGGVTPRFRLAVTYGIGTDLIGIQKDNSVSRVRLVGNARWTLTADAPGGGTLVSGSARAVDGYDIINQQFFAADLSSEAVVRRLAEAVAARITLQLAAWFNGHPAA